jgi:hypothetical protein
VVHASGCSDPVQAVQAAVNSILESGTSEEDSACPFCSNPSGVFLRLAAYPMLEAAQSSSPPSNLLCGPCRGFSVGADNYHRPDGQGQRVAHAKLCAAPTGEAFPFIDGKRKQ